MGRGKERQVKVRFLPTTFLVEGLEQEKAKAKAKGKAKGRAKGKGKGKGKAGQIAESLRRRDLPSSGKRSPGSSF